MSRQLTLVDTLRQRVQEQGDTPAFIFRSPHHDRYVMTWSSLYRLAGRFAAVLHSRGVGRGHLVVNTLVNSPERVVCEAAIWMSGAASVNGHCQMADGSDLLHTLRVSRASALLVDPDVTNSPWYVLNKHVALGDDDSVISSALKDLKKLFFIRRVEGGSEEDFLTHLEAQNDWFEADDINPEDTLTLFTTSGTTGFSKLVINTHSDLVQRAESAQKDKAARPACKFSLAPLGWIGGFPGIGVVSLMTRVMFDIRAEQNSEDTDIPTRILKTIMEEKCDTASIPTVHLKDLVQLVRISQEKPGSESGIPMFQEIHKPKSVILSGLPITKAMVAHALCIGHAVSMGYSGTDFLLVSRNAVMDSETFVDHDTGLPREGVTVKIVSQEDEDIALPVNQTGHILVKGTIYNHGYLRHSESCTEDPFTKDGFFRTGDVGCLDERGHLIVDGRGGDAIMRGPYIFHPTWMESRIQNCPGVRDVIVTGVPDPSLNEEICACVVLDSDSVTLDQVRHFVEKDVVTSEDDPLSPRPRHYLKFEAFPLTDTNKPKRKVIKALAAERLPTST